MKSYIFILFSFSTMSLTCCANANSAYSQHGSHDPSRKDYYNEWGQHQGHSKKQAHSNRTDHYNSWGQNQGYSKKDPYSGEIRHYNEWGQYQGSTR